MERSNRVIYFPCDSDKCFFYVEKILYVTVIPFWTALLLWSTGLVSTRKWCVQSTEFRVLVLTVAFLPLLRPCFYRRSQITALHRSESWNTKHRQKKKGHQCLFRSVSVNSSSLGLSLSSVALSLNPPCQIFVRGIEFEEDETISYAGYHLFTKSNTSVIKFCTHYLIRLI